MSNDTNTRLYLLYNTEDIDEYLTDPRIFPLKLTPQTVFFESEAFRNIPLESIPDEIEYIGFITPSFLRKSRGKTLSSFRHTGENNTVVGVDIPVFHYNYVDTAQYFHPHFRILWDWLIQSMGFPQGYTYKNLHMYANMWLTKRNIAFDAIRFIRRAIELLESVPEHIRILLYSNPNYGGKLTPEQLLDKFGIPHYPYHPFLLERLIIFFCDIHNLRIDQIV